MLNNFHFVIYRIYNIVSNKSYIGKCTRGKDRIKSHFNVYKNPNYEYRARLLYRAMNKHGIHEFDFEILCEVETLEQLDLKEIECIKNYETTNPHYGYNITKGGTGGDTYSNLTQEEKLIRGKRLSLAIKNSYTDERKKESSIRLKKTRADKNKSLKNAQVCSLRMKTLNKTDPRFMGPNKKEVYCVQTGEIYTSIKALAKFLNRCPGTIQWFLNKRNGFIDNNQYIKLIKKKSNA